MARRTDMSRSRVASHCSAELEQAVSTWDARMAPTNLRIHRIAAVSLVSSVVARTNLTTLSGKFDSGHAVPAVTSPVPFVQLELSWPDPLEATSKEHEVTQAERDV